MALQQKCMGAICPHTHDVTMLIKTCMVPYYIYLWRLQDSLHSLDQALQIASTFCVVKQ